MQIKSNVSLDVQTKTLVSKLPRDVSVSGMVRWVIKAVVLTDLQFERELRKDSGLKAAHEFIAPRICKIVGVKK